MKEITALELKKLIDNKEDIQLIDVREEQELAFCSIGGELIPMGEVMDNLDNISKTKPVIFYCRSGARSGAVCQILVAEGYTNIYNLVGGILSWANDVDPTMTKY